MLSLCPPAIIYVIFSLTQIIIDTVKGMFNTAIMKIFVMIMVTILLQILCQSGLNIISWIIVFIPFIFMTVIVSILLYVFGLNATTGNLDYSCESIEGVKKNEAGDIIVYDPHYDPTTHPVYYSYPNVIVPVPVKTQSSSRSQPQNQTTSSPSQNYATGSSSPAYQN